MDLSPSAHGSRRHTAFGSTLSAKSGTKIASGVVPANQARKKAWFASRFEKLGTFLNSEYTSKSEKTLLFRELARESAFFWFAGTTADNSQRWKLGIPAGIRLPVDIQGQKHLAEVLETLGKHVGALFLPGQHGRPWRKWRGWEQLGSENVRLSFQSPQCARAVESQCKREEQKRTGNRELRTTQANHVCNNLLSGGTWA